MSSSRICIVSRHLSPTNSIDLLETPDQIAAMAYELNGGLVPRDSHFLGSLLCNLLEGEKDDYFTAWPNRHEFFDIP